ncbi:SulP family inorganic anion transporter [Aridibaculum aurantiacum]|uniref:SulP family inorganic anion transporter n=1 Tax=Aridibaculum aurantiacum TaxID=2810307 RepID=UPI001A978A95|nr:SulP family inorganic anion transporter [Aridibaculum aurantiacum]
MKNFFRNVGADFPASIVVFLVALPLCLGIALGSGAPLFSGIIAGIVGGIVIGSLSGSQLSVSGPAAGLTVIVAAAILNLKVFDAFLLAVVLAGAFQILFGFLRAGILGDYVPNTVIKGMMAAIGLILILKQIPHLVGYDADFIGDEKFLQLDKQNTFSELANMFNYIAPPAVVIGVVSLLILMLWETKAFKKQKFLLLIPGPLVVVVAGVLLNQAFQLYSTDFNLEQKHLVSLMVAEDLPQFISFFTLPGFQHITNPDVWISAGTIAIIASLETLLSIEAVDKLDPLRRRTPTNRELKAQGVGNFVSGMIGGLPLTSVVVRSSANVVSGARTKLSTILHGVFMLVAVMFIPRILNLIPLSALAAILIFTGYKLAKVSLFKDYYKKGWDQFVPFVVTIIAILLTDLLVGIIIGLGVGLFFMIRSNFRSSVFVVNDHNRYLVRLRKDVSFLNKPIIKRKLDAVPEGSSVVVDATRADFIDKDIIEEINNFIINAKAKDIHVEVKKTPHNPMHQLFTSADGNKD